MGTTYCLNRTNHVKDKINTSDPRSLLLRKRFKSERLVGESLVFVGPSERAVEEFHACAKNGKISFAEYKKLLFRINCHLSKSQLRNSFTDADTDGDGELNEAEFIACFIKLDERPTMRRLFNECDALVNGYVTGRNLWDFYQRTAPSDALSGWRQPSLVECDKLVADYIARCPNAAGESHSTNKLNYAQFLLLLSDSERNHVCNPDWVFRVYQDMTHPLSHYFISSSHNTYLDGNQTNSNSTPEAIKHALLLGVRVVELDAWDGPKKEPIVTHGHTMCKPTSFESCIEAIAQTAFVASEYPVILTIENHCTKQFQERMAQILTNTLGDLLFRFHSVDADEISDEDLFRGPEEWASPEQLKRKVVIRDKPKALIVRKSIKKLSNAVSRESSATAIPTSASSSPVVAQVEKKKAAPTEPRVISLRKSKPPLKVSFLEEPSSKAPNPPDALKATLSERKKSLFDASGNMIDDDEDELDEYVDESMENEGFGDMTVAKMEAKRGEIDAKLASMRKKLEGSFSSFNNKGGGKPLLTPEEEIGIASDLPGQTTNSVPQLLEITYIKNVKLKAKLEKRRTSYRPGESLQSGDFSRISVNYPPWRSSSSLGESKMLEWVKPGIRSAAINTYTKEHLIRCYPAGTRFESTNYDPCPAWNAGIQIVALNFQTNGLSVWKNQGKFSDNGACGYVLKPQAMLNARTCGKSGQRGDPQAKYWDLSFISSEERADRLTVTVLSAHWLPKPLGENVQTSEIIDPFVELAIYGFEPDQTSRKTKCIDDNGFDPEFNEEFQFILRKPLLDLLSVTVKDKDLTKADFIGQTVIPVNMLRPGYRVIPLRRADSSPLPDAFVFVLIQWERDSVSLEERKFMSEASVKRNLEMSGVNVAM